MGKPEETNKLIGEFADKLFELNPALEGLSVSGVLPERRYVKEGYCRINGYYVKNKKIKSGEKGDEGRAGNP